VRVGRPEEVLPQVRRCLPVFVLGGGGIGWRGWWEQGGGVRHVYQVVLGVRAVDCFSCYVVT